MQDGVRPMCAHIWEGKGVPLVSQSFFLAYFPFVLTGAVLVTTSVESGVSEFSENGKARFNWRAGRNVDFMLTFESRRAVCLTLLQFFGQGQ